MNSPRTSFVPDAQDSAATIGVADRSLAEQIASAFLEARCRWPTVDLPLEEYADHVTARLPGNNSSPAAVTQLHTTDLYLACACGQSNVAAIEAFEAQCMSAVDHALAQLRLGADDVDEVKQRLRERLLVHGGGEARIQAFSGRGTLRAWLMVMATREALALRRRTRRELSIEEDQEALQEFVTSGDGELVQLKTRFADAFKEAFDASLKALPPRDQTLLRQHVLDGLSIDQLGAFYRVHRSTAARSIDRVRRALLSATRSRMRSRFGVASTELDSILRLVRSQIEISLRVLLGRRPAPKPRPSVRPR